MSARAGKGLKERGIEREGERHCEGGRGALRGRERGLTGDVRIARGELLACADEDDQARNAGCYGAAASLSASLLLTNSSPAWG